jgi:uncharacterized membrane protein
MAHKKTLTFAILHMSIAFGVVWALTGSMALGGAVALIEPMLNTIAYFFHEKVWERWGHFRSKAKQPPEGPIHQ